MHLEDNQMCYYNENNQNIEEILEKSKKTTLTQWFEINKKHPETRHLKYMNISDAYVWNKFSREWTKRKKCHSVGRMAFVSPNEGERFYLRLLLVHVSGATSFEDLRTVNGITYNTFKETAYALELLKDDEEYNKCLLEASEIKTGKQLRFLFANIIIYNIIEDPYKLWLLHENSLCEDILFKEQRRSQNKNIHLNKNMINHALYEVEQILNQSGISLSQFKTFPVLKHDYTDKETELLNSHMNYDYDELDQFVKNNHSTFNSEQLIAYNKIIDSFENKSEQKLFFIDGCGGTGKTRLFNTILAQVRKNDNIALSMASTGVASLLLTNGNTAHSTLHLPTQPNETSLCQIKNPSPLLTLIQETKLFVWDEAPCMSKYYYESVDRTLRDIMKSVSPELEHQPFGGNLFYFKTFSVFR